MGKPGFVRDSANGEDSDAMAEVRRLVALLPPEETTPIFDMLAARYAKWGWLDSILNSDLHVRE